MNNDLISREALKKHKVYSLERHEYVVPVYNIDNAPTVERPQGEWINREAVSNTTFPFWERYECNKCHKYSGYSNFCPNCGANMKKGEEE